MGTVTRNRTIRPSTRLEKSKSYKIDTKAVKASDTLIVNIDHESKDFNKSYTFKGSDVANKNSISFRVADFGTRIDISWSGAEPQGMTAKGSKPTKNMSIIDAILTNSFPIEKYKNGHIQGLPPVVNNTCKLLILGTMPGAESLKKQEYYAHSGNLFWRLIAAVLNEKIPGNYSDKKKLLLDNHISIWDVCQTCFREGSLDLEIEGEEPNDLMSFLDENPEIKTIAFNGKESSKLFAKHYGSIPGIKLLVLPSTSPANAAISWEIKLSEWNKIKDKLHNN